MLYVLSFVVGVILGASAMFIYKNKLLKEAKKQSEALKAKVASLS